jgi:hypothetical protein
VAFLRNSNTARSTNCVRLALLAAAGIVVCAAFDTRSTRSEAAALVGDSRKVELPKAADRSIEEMKADYRWPAAIPFPADNPYTAEKVRSARSSFSTAGCPPPIFCPVNLATTRPSAGATACPKASATA